MASSTTSSKYTSQIASRSAFYDSCLLLWSRLHWFCKKKRITTAAFFLRSKTGICRFWSAQSWESSRLAIISISRFAAHEPCNHLILCNIWTTHFWPKSLTWLHHWKKIGEAGAFWRSHFQNTRARPHPAPPAARDRYHLRALPRSENPAEAKKLSGRLMLTLSTKAERAWKKKIRNCLRVFFLGGQVLTGVFLVVSVMNFGGSLVVGYSRAG